MTVVFEIHTANGSIHCGAVMGSGGYLGGGAAHMGKDRERTVASKELTRLIAFANRKGELPPGIARMPGGLCLLWPQEWLNADFDVREALLHKTKSECNAPFPGRI